MPKCERHVVTICPEPTKPAGQVSQVPFKVWDLEGKKPRAQYRLRLLYHCFRDSVEGASELIPLQQTHESERLIREPRTLL
jgi:hypothetical protein